MKTDLLGRFATLVVRRFAPQGAYLVGVLLWRLAAFRRRSSLAADAEGA